jgi:hypothetical protein
LRATEQVDARDTPRPLPARALLFTRGVMTRAAFGLAILASCAVPPPGAPRGAAYKMNAISIGVGALVAFPWAVAAAECDTCQELPGGELLIGGTVAVVTGLVGIAATAIGVTCPGGKSVWTCAGTAPPP